MAMYRMKGLPVYKHPVKKWFLIGYGAGGTLLAGGFALQLTSILDAGLSRAGALIVLVGILLGWTDIRNRLNRVEMVVADAFDRDPPVDSQTRNTQFLNMEAILLGGGTVVWGFGDWPGFVAALLAIAAACIAVVNTRQRGA